MTIRFSCRVCQKPLSAPDEKAGVGVVCPRCKHPLKVPSSSPKLEQPVKASWYYMLQGQQHGPVSESALKQLFSSGKLQLADLIWQQGMKEWMPAHAVKGLFPVVTAAPSTSRRRKSAEREPQRPKEPPPLLPAVVPATSRSKMTGNLVTGEISLAGRWGVGVEQVDLFLGGEHLATGSWHEGIQLVYFQSTVGHHSLIIRETGGRLQEKIRSFVQWHIGGDGETKRTYQIDFSEPGHYSLTFKTLWVRSALTKFPTGIEKVHSAQPLEVVPASEVRKKSIVGLWQAVNNSGLSFMFTKDGAMVRHDGLATTFRWLSKSRIELYADDCNDTVSFEILSLSEYELVLKTEAQSAHFQRGVSITEAGLAKLEADARKRRAEAAENFKNVAFGVAAVLAAGGFVILCGGLAVAAAGSGGGVQQQQPSGAANPSPASTGPQEHICNTCYGKGWLNIGSQSTNFHLAERRCSDCGGQGVRRY